MKNQIKTDLFCFKLDEVKIKQGLRLSLKARLQWLDEANQFVSKVLTPEQQKAWGKFKKFGSEKKRRL